MSSRCGLASDYYTYRRVLFYVRDMYEAWLKFSWGRKKLKTAKKVILFSIFFWFCAVVTVVTVVLCVGVPVAVFVHETFDPSSHFIWSVALTDICFHSEHFRSGNLKKVTQCQIQWVQQSGRVAKFATCLIPLSFV
jgi:hypothetical protein